MSTQSLKKPSRLSRLPANYKERGFEICSECEQLRPVDDFPNPAVKLCVDCYEPKTLLLSHSGRNSLYSIVKGIQFMTLCGVINSEKGSQRLVEILSEAVINKEVLRNAGRILAEDSIRETIFYLIREEAATYLTITNGLQIPERTVWRSLNTLNTLGIITPSVPVRPDLKKAGRKVVVFQTPDATPERIKEAIELHRRLKSPIFASSHRATQLLIDDYATKHREPSIGYRELLSFVREQGLPEPINTANLTAKQLTDAGWKIWR